MSSPSQQLIELSQNLELAAARAGQNSYSIRLLTHWFRLSAELGLTPALAEAWQESWRQVWTESGVEMPLTLPYPLTPAEPPGFALFGDEQTFAVQLEQGQVLALHQIESITATGRRVRLSVGKSKTLEFTAVGDRYVVDAAAPTSATPDTPDLTFVHKAAGSRQLAFSSAGKTRLVSVKRST